jgi:hypothetical protein
MKSAAAGTLPGLSYVEPRFVLDTNGTSGDDHASANNLAHVLDFASGKVLSAPRFEVPAGPFGSACTGTAGNIAQARPELAGLAALAAESGFAIGRR